MHACTAATPRASAGCSYARAVFYVFVVHFTHMRVLFHTNAIAVGICTSPDLRREKYEVDHSSITRPNNLPFR